MIGVILSYGVRLVGQRAKLGFYQRVMCVYV